MNHLLHKKPNLLNFEVKEINSSRNAFFYFVFIVVFFVCLFFYF